MGFHPENFRLTADNVRCLAFLSVWCLCPRFLQAYGFDSRKNRFPVDVCAWKQKSYVTLGINHFRLFAKI